jgi:hypothetical protein
LLIICLLLSNSLILTPTTCGPTRTGRSANIDILIGPNVVRFFAPAQEPPQSGELDKAALITRKSGFGSAHDALLPGR